MSDNFYKNIDKEREEILYEAIKKSHNFKYLKDLEIEIKSNAKHDELSVEFLHRRRLRHYFNILLDGDNLMKYEYIYELIDEVRRRFVDNLFNVAESFGLSEELVRRSDYEKMYHNFARYIFANCSKIFSGSDIDSIAKGINNDV